MPDVIQTVLLTTDQLLRDQILETLTLTTFETTVISNPKFLAEMLIDNSVKLAIVDLRGIHKHVLGDSIISTLTTSLQPIIFIDDNTNRILDSFQFYIMDFIVLPLTEVRLMRALKKIKKLVAQKHTGSRPPYSLRVPQSHPTNPFEKLAIKNAGKIQFIATRDILYIEASGYYLEISTSEKKILLRESMSQILTRLPSHTFIRIHRSTIINLKHMQEIHKINSRELQITMQNGELLKVSNSYKKSLFHKINL